MDGLDRRYNCKVDNGKPQVDKLSGMIKIWSDCFKITQAQHSGHYLAV